MKWNYHTSRQIRNDKYRKWHRWFAWHPVKVSDTDKVWFEFILRKQRSRINFSWIDRFFMVPDYDYKESILDLIKSPYTVRRSVDDWDDPVTK